MYKRLILEFTGKVFIFDWDDNVLHMPTTIKMLKKVGDSYVDVEVSTADFTSVRHDPDYKLKDNSFANFSDDDVFLVDVKTALKEKRFGPSFNKFKTALTSGSNFAIITARGHSPEVIKKGIKLFIEMVLSVKEKTKMIKSLDGKSVDQYLNEQEYHTVTSKSFANRFGITHGAKSPEEGKKIAFKDYVDKIMKHVATFVDSNDYKKLSFGFSDDDISNVKHIEELIEKELKKTYPDIHFAVYDTSDPKNVKKKIIKIEKVD